MPRLFSALALAFALAACDSGSPPPPTTGSDGLLGSSHVTAEGATAGTFDGSAFVTVDANGAFILTLVSGPPHDLGPDHAGVVFATTHGQPGVGTYGLASSEEADDQLVGSYQERRSEGQSVVLLSDNGEITITSSSEEGVEGHFTFAGTALDETLQLIGEVTVRGTFDAPRL